MAILDLIFGERQKSSVGVIEFDALLSYVMTDTNTITEHAVEFGADITDHVRSDPETITLDGLITNFPILFLKSLQAESPIIGDKTQTKDRVKSAYDKLRELQRKGELVSIHTPRRDYQDMVISSLSVRQDAQTGTSLPVVIELRRVDVVLLEERPEPLFGADGPSSKTGNKGAGKTPDAAQKSKGSSILRSIGK